MNIFVTGSAGFIGSELCLNLLERGSEVVGIDNHNDYYDPSLKEERLKRLNQYSRYTHIRGDLCDHKKIEKIFSDFKPGKVVNLAAQAGVRYSLKNPISYINSNVLGFVNILEGCRHYKVDHLVYASTSSIYGANTSIPFSEHDNANHPLSLYAASKKSNELLAHSYSHLYQVPTTGLRFFTVYGPWGRPDMALFKFTKAILDEQPIDVFNYGKHTRDFTYIDDVIKGIVQSLDNPPSPDLNWNSLDPDPATSNAPWRIYNVGNSKPTKLTDYINALEQALNKKAKINFLPLQPGDVQDTFADISFIKQRLDYSPSTSVNEGVLKFVDWYMDFYKI
mgnify:CR=1 FL=1|tara:strand:- start:264 stop:1271 length:1008 start_codon:yes stop_codon:yes gene_type:complete